MVNLDRTVTTIELKSSTWPFFWIKWATVWILAMAIWTALRLPVLLLQGEFQTALYAAVLFSPLYLAAWVVWRNVSVLRSIVDRWMLPALWLLVVYCVAVIVLVAMALSEGVSSKTEQFNNLANGFYGVMGVMLVAPAIAAILWCRKMKIDGLDASLMTVCGGFSRSKTNTLGHRPKANPRGWLWIGAALALTICADYLLPLELLMENEALRPLRDAVNLLELLAVLRARSAFQPDAAALLAADPRPPVLYLRSFSDDLVRQRSNSAANLIDYNLESRLAADFSAKGPFVAVAAPKSKAITLGAARASLTDDQWQAQVIKWMDESSLIVILVGVTAWVDWELRQVLTRKLECKLLVCFPQMGLPNFFARDRRLRSREAVARMRLDTLQAAFVGTDWHAQLMTLQDPTTLRCIVYRPDGQVVAIRAKSKSRNSHHLAALIGCYLLERGQAAAVLR
ncbi:hypothetical protein [Variovorax sp. RCC_210]|uniref:hypothetical protein n=1 Tax=Variovorax sp. RCC_210 TaxID=3239217 RepID=UPI0035243837